MHKDLTDTEDAVDGTDQMGDYNFFGFDNERMMRGEPEDALKTSTSAGSGVVEEDLIVPEFEEETFASASAPTAVSKSISTNSRGAKLNARQKPRLKKAEQNCLVKWFLR